MDSAGTILTNSVGEVFSVAIRDSASRADCLPELLGLPMLGRW
jgi:hypothetical protein